MKNDKRHSANCSISEDDCVLLAYSWLIFSGDLPVKGLDFYQIGIAILSRWRINTLIWGAFLDTQYNSPEIGR